MRRSLRSTIVCVDEQVPQLEEARSQAQADLFHVRRLIVELIE